MYLSTTVAQLKQMLASREGCAPVEHQLLYANGRTMRNHKSMRACGVSAGSTVLMTSRLLGGGQDKVRVSMVSSFTYKRAINIYQVVCMFLCNIGCTCVKQQLRQHHSSCSPELRRHFSQWHRHTPTHSRARVFRCYSANKARMAS